MSDSKPNISAPSRVNAIIASLPAHLKDPANFLDIERRVEKTLRTSCFHSDVLEMAKCAKCTKKMLDRRHYLKSIGFKNAAQYLTWKKIHLKIKERFPLVDWKAKSIITP